MLPPNMDKRFQELKEGFSFSCHPGVPCFNECCRKLTLWLTPYDFLRLRANLGLSSDEFLDRYCTVEHGQNGWPMPRMVMLDNERETCPLVSEKGCTVYPDRPGACRTYPLGRATKGGTQAGINEEGFFLVREEHCRGFEEGPQWTPQDWIKDQGLETYFHMNDLFMPLLTRQAPDPNPQVIAKKMQMFFMACYKLESFRKFLNQTRLTEIFELNPNRAEILQNNDLELLKFAFQWLQFSIFGDATLTVKPEVKKRMEEKAKQRGMEQPLGPVGPMGPQGMFPGS